MLYDRYYYSNLNKREQQIYKDIYNGISNCIPEIHICGSAITDNSLSHIIMSIDLDNPHLFYADFSKYKFTYSPLKTTIYMEYWYSKNDIKVINEKIQNVLQRMLAKVDKSSDYSKEITLHNLLIENILYDSDSLNNFEHFYPRSNSIIGVLFYKTAVCEGIAKVVKLLLNLLDIKCIIAVGESMQNGENHAWNIVKIDNLPYHLDVTWDLNASNKKTISYDYFNLTDKDIQMDHSLGFVYPNCTSLTNNYYYKNGLIANNLVDIEKIIIKANKLHQNNITFRLLNSSSCTFQEAAQFAVKRYGMQRMFINTSKVCYTENIQQCICSIFCN